MEEYVKKLLDSKAVVSSQVDDLTRHNEHLCQELIKIDQLAEQLEKEKNFVVDTADKELEEAKVLDLSLIRFFFFFKLRYNRHILEKAMAPNSGTLA